MQRGYSACRVSGSFCCFMAFAGAGPCDPFEFVLYPAILVLVGHAPAKDRRFPVGLGGLWLGHYKSSPSGVW